MRPIPAIPMPLTVDDWRRARHAAPDAPAELAEACRARLGALAAFSLSSGRTALWLALQALQRLRPGRPKVILPAYTCPTVGRAVQAAGLQGLCADVSLGDFAIAPEAVAELLDENVLAVVAVHMFGTACDVRALGELCRRQGVVLIEDLAQAFGAHCHGREIGAFGAIGFNSLGRSKNVRGDRGGVLWVNDPDLVPAIEQEYKALPQAPPSVAPEQLKQLATILLSKPSAWQAARRLPFLRVGAEDQGFDESPARLAAWQAALGLISLRRVDQYNAIRRQLGEALREALAGVTGLEPQMPGPGCDSTFLRLALRVDGSPANRDELVRRLQQHGIDARAFYTRAMYEYVWWNRDIEQPRCPVAETLLNTNLILPVHYAMDASQIEPVVNAVEEHSTRGA